MRWDAMHEFFRAKIEEASLCSVRWKDRADDMLPINPEAMRAVCYLSISSHTSDTETLEEYNETTNQVDLREITRSKTTVVAQYESDLALDNQDAKFYATRAQTALRRVEFQHAFNVAQHHVTTGTVRQGPILIDDDDGREITTAVLELFWYHAEEVTSTDPEVATPDRRDGPGLVPLEWIETAEISGVTQPDPPIVVPPTFYPGAVVISPGPGGVGGGYNYSQATPSALWTIAHNLGYFPSVVVRDAGGNEVIADIQNLSANVLTISFFAPLAGTARLQ